MLKCADCGKTFAGDFIRCPYCGSGEFAEATKCSGCGKWHLDTEDKYTEMCDECLEENKFLYRYNAKKCFDLSKNQKESVEINSFLLSQFSAEEIENILLNELSWEQRTPYSDYINFIEKDEWWFVTEISERGEKN